MARRQVSMNEIIEMIYQWHQGKSIKGIERSFGIDRKTVHKYVRLVQSIRVYQEAPLSRGDRIGESVEVF